MKVIRVWQLFALAVALAALVLLVAMVASPLVGDLIWTPFSEGTRFDATRARLMVAKQPALLTEVRALASRDESPSVTQRRRELALRLGALSVESEPVPGGVARIICFRRYGGAGETYEEQLRWLPPASVEQVRAGTWRPGEYWEEIGDGWFWVVY